MKSAPDRPPVICSAPDCEEAVDAQGLCHGHYLRLWRTGVRDTSPLRRETPSCLVETCPRKAERRGYCQAHYKRVLKHGHPQADVPIREVDGLGTIAHDGYKSVPVPPELRHLTKGAAWVAEHRLVMARLLGRALTSDEQVHHINGDRADNRLENLELWSTSHPAGRRIEDLIEFCQVMLDRYGDEYGLLVPGRIERSFSPTKTP